MIKKIAIISIFVAWSVAMLSHATVINWGGNTFTGLTSDTKPTNVATGSRYYETDGRRREWIYTGGTWTTIFSNLSGTNTGDQDLSALQTRVTGTCASGLAVGAINADGSVVCVASGGSTTVDLSNYTTFANMNASITSSISSHSSVTTLVHGFDSLGNVPYSYSSGTALYSNNANTAIYSNTSNTANIALGNQPWHGIQSIGTITFNNATHVLSVASVTFWNKGVKVESATAMTATIDSFSTITSNKLYFFKYDDTTSRIVCTTNAWSIMTDIPIATVYWNGSVGALQYEAHKYDRNLEWHLWAHDTIGSRYEQGGTLVAPTSGNPTGLNISSVNLHDEDIDFTTGTMTSARYWYLANATAYTHSTGTLPYTGTVGNPTYLNTGTYTLTAVAAGSYAPYWVYGSNDVDYPLYIIPHHGAANLTLTQAQATTPPSLAQLGLNPELKLLYRWIYRGSTGAFQESSDYRTTSSIPSGGTPAIAASSVIFSPTGNITAAEVQTAIQQVSVGTTDLVTGGAMGVTSLATGSKGNESTGITIDNTSTTAPLISSDINNAYAANVILHKHSQTVAPTIVSGLSYTTTSSHQRIVNDKSALDIVATVVSGDTYTNYNKIAQISMKTDPSGTITPTSSPGRMVFSVTSNNSVTATERMSINSDGTISAQYFAGISTSPTLSIGNIGSNFTFTVSLGSALTLTNPTAAVTMSIPLPADLTSTQTILACISQGTTTRQVTLDTTGNGTWVISPGGLTSSGMALPQSGTAGKTDCYRFEYLGGSIRKWLLSNILFDNR